MTLNFPDAEPSITLDFLKSKKLDPRITFSRASDANTTPPTTGEGSGNVNGEVYTFPENVPRLTSQGLLIEESRTNLIENSLVTSANGWQDLGTLTANNALAPDGTMTASTCLPASGAQQTITSPLRIVPAAGIYTFSAFVQPTSVFTHFKLGVVNYADTGNQSVIFDTTKTGIDGDGITPNGSNNSNYLGATMDKSYAHGWVRLSLTVNFVGPDLNGVMQLSNANPSVGDGVNSFAVWHGQLEEGNFPTSLIPTSGAAATRAADVANMLNIDWFNASETTLLIENNSPFWNTNNAFFSVVNSSGVTANRVSFRGGNYLASSTNGAMFGSAIVPPTPPGKSYYNTHIKYAFVYDSTDAVVASSYGLGTPRSNTTGSAPVGIDQAKISQLETGVITTAYVTRVSYYPTRLPDDALISLTVIKDE